MYTSKSAVVLLQRNGSEGQFAAAAAVLSQLQEQINKRDIQVVQTIIKALTLSTSPPSAFWVLVCSFKQSLAQAKDCNPEEAFSADDHWLIAQAGIALLLLSEHNKDWESGFQVLFCLHTHGTHYVGQPPPGEPTQEFKVVSHCSVALMALRICLESNKPTGALEVLRGCNWVLEAGTPEESQRRVILLTALLVQCAEAGILQDAYKCLLSLLEEPAELLDYSHTLVFACNKLIRNYISVGQIRQALRVYQRLEKLDLGKSCCLFECLTKEATTTPLSMEKVYVAIKHLVPTPTPVQYAPLCSFGVRK